MSSRHAPGGSDCGARPDCQHECVWVEQGLKPCGLQAWREEIGTFTAPPPRVRSSVVVIAGPDSILTEVDLARIEWHANGGNAD